MKYPGHFKFLEIIVFSFNTYYTSELSVCGALIRPSTTVRSWRPAGVWPVHEASCCVDSRLLLSPATSHQELHQVVASWGCEGGCRLLCHFEGWPLPRHASSSWCSPLAASPISHRVQALSTRLSITTRCCSRVFARLLHCNSFLRVRATTAITREDWSTCA